MGELRFVQVDVFTDTVFGGNPLAVVFGADGLGSEVMQKVAREMNCSETTFLLTPTRPDCAGRVRIFTPAREIPFAGHPTIGTAFALAHAGVLKPGTTRSVFGLGVGPTPIDLEWNGARLKFAWMTQLNPTFGKTIADPAALGAALGLDAASLAVQRAPAQEVHTGSTFLIVPLATRKAVDAAVLDRAKMDAVLTAAGAQRRGVYVFSTERAQDDTVAYTRLLGTGGIEDPATGSAAGPAGCFMVRYGFVPPSAARSIVILQGVLVKRPSRIHVNITAGGTGATPDITLVKVGGSSVVVGDGNVTV